MTAEIYIGLKTVHKQSFFETLNNESSIISNVTNSVAAYFDVSAMDIMSSKRTARITSARHICMYLIRKRKPSIPFKVIGSFFGNRDHSTVMYSIDTVNDQLKVSKGYRITMDEIEGNL